MFDREKEILGWKAALASREFLGPEETEELEDHLRSQMSVLEKAGLTPEEAFLIGVRRLGEARELSGEFRKVRGLVWKGWSLGRTEALAACLTALMAAGLALLPGAFGIAPFGSWQEGDTAAYWRWAAFYFVPPVTLLFLIKARAGWKEALVPLGLLAGAFTLVSVFQPVRAPYETAALTGWHLLVALWFCAFLAYRGNDRTPEGAMNFIRVTGEAFLFTTLILLGGLVLIVLVMVTFGTIGIRADDFCQNYLGPAGLFAAPVVGLFLADSKKGVIENLAPVLAKIFSPLFLAALVVFLAFGFASGRNPFDDRNSLGIADFILGMCLALVVYALSARKPESGPTASDALLLGLTLTALAVEAGVLGAVVQRIGQFGFSPNKTALLGANLLLASNLGFLAFRYGAFFARRGTFADLLRTQSRFLPLYAGWAAVVALVLPAVFGFR